MANPAEIERWKKEYSTISDAELIAKKHEWLPHAAMHIAAVQLIHERQQAKEKANHVELLAEIKRPHWSVTPLFWVSVLAAVAACIAAYPVLFPSQAQKSASPVPPTQNGPTKSPTPSIPLPAASPTSSEKSPP